MYLAETPLIIVSTAKVYIITDNDDFDESKMTGYFCIYATPDYCKLENASK